MPNNKRNKNGSNRAWTSDSSLGRVHDTKYYYEHDDRVGDTIRRVSFKPWGNRIGKHRSRDLDLAIRAHLEDDDIDMSGPGGSGRSGRFNPYGGRGRNQGSSLRGSGGKSSRSGSPLPSQFNRRKFQENSASWYKVTIPHGAKYKKDYILKTLLANIAPVTFIPLAYEVRGNESSFYVDDAYVAEKLASIDKRVTTIKGFKLLVKVRAGMPHVDIDSTLKEKIKSAMVKRFNSDMKALNLSRFHTDPDLVENYAVALFRPTMLTAVLDIIVENIPDLSALDLSDNKLYSLDNLSVLTLKVPNLKILHIGKNRIRDMHMLDSLEGVRLEELVLDGNPLCEKYQDQNVYVSDVRKRFPKVMKLDGVDLPPPILFDVSEEDFKMPVNKGNFLCVEESMTIVRQFLEQYYRLYDSDNRDQLVNAYHADAMFSITSTYPPGQSSSTNKLVNYITDSRNLLRVRENSRRQKLLYRGRSSIISCLSKLPKTQHDPLSFAVDLPLFTPHLIEMSVAGLFLESEHVRNQPLRSFSRVFVIVPFGEGFCIINEQLFVTNATEEQSKVAFKSTPETLPPPAPAPTPVPTPVPTVSSPPQALLIDNTKQQMLDMFAAQTGMNTTWAKKCLDETQWNYQMATSVFNQLKGTIPPEAFMK